MKKKPSELAHSSSTDEISVLYYIAALVAAAALSFAIFNKLAPLYLHADIIMHSIMSIENITLFYWGQNRLLNFLPAAAYLVSPPIWNLTAILWMSSFISISAFYCISILSCRYVLPNSSDTQLFLSSLLVTTILVCFILAIFTPYFLFDFLVGHVEYPLPILLLWPALHSISSLKTTETDRIALDSLLIFVAIFVNPSAAFIIFFIFAASYCGNRKNLKKTGIYTLITAASLAIWRITSEFYPSASYSSFDIKRIPNGLIKLLENFESATIEYGESLFYAALLASIFSAYFARANRKNYWKVVSLLLIFTAAWIILFCSNNWVKANGFNVRYFTYSIFAALGMISLTLARLQERITSKAKITIFSTLALVLAIETYSPFTPIPQYPVFKKHSETEFKTNLIAGNYWKVWPIVFSKLDKPVKLIGVAYRGEGNREAAIKEAKKEILEQGQFQVYCLRDTPENCIDQVERTFKPLTVQHIGINGGDKNILNFKLKETNET